MTLHISLVDTHEKLLALGPEWDSLAAENPFLGRDWCELWWRHYETPQLRLMTLAVRDQTGALVGLAPWYLQHNLVTGRKIQFIGSNEVCGDRLTILAEPTQRAAVVEAIARWLTDEAQDEWDLLEITGVEAADEAVNALSSALSERGHATHRRPDMNCWRIELADTWESYLATISRSRRSKSRNLLKKTFGTGKAVLRSVTSFEDFQHGFNVLIELHQKRRNRLGEPGCFASERYHAFHHDFAQRMLAQNRLRLAWTELEGQPAAIDYGFVAEKTVFNYQSGLEPALEHQHPGKLHLAATLKSLIESGYRAFDMLRGDEPYKASYGAMPTPLTQIRIAGRQPSARLRHAAWRTQATVKRWARTGLKLAADWRQPTLANQTEEAVES
jgi:CelD/BcsL family acetyltransferase involved in cellulose biosynthesis